MKKMIGENNLEKLLASMSPGFIEGEYVFCTFPEASYGDRSELNPVASFIEAEGLTLVIPEAIAKKNGLSYESVFKGISMKVHSSLDAVGLTAAVSRKLTEHGISANVIAGYYHDHVFVQKERAEEALESLKGFSH